MTDYFEEFPYEEIRRDDGNYFWTVGEALQAGHNLENIWSVVESEGTFTYGPSHHYVNLIGYIATAEAHDGETYYEEHTL